MSVHLSVSAIDPVAGPDPLTVLRQVCAATDSDVTMLHSAAGQSDSVLAFDRLITLEIEAQGQVHLACPFDLLPPFDPLGPPHSPPLSVLEHVVKAFGFAAPHPLIGWLGFISYDIGRTLEEIGTRAPDELRWPLLRWTLFRHYLLHDAACGQWRAVGIGGAPRGVGEFIAEGTERGGAVRAAPMVRAISAADYGAKVERVKEYIAAGDIYQANLAQRWEVAPVSERSGADSALEIYQRLCASSPAPYAGFLRFVSADGTPRQVLSASPELFLSVNDGRVITRPIKGTRRRDATDPVHDAALREELLASEKDQAELAMIVDLMRNDLGRVAEYGTVQVTAARDIEAHPTVWHTVATIAATLRRDAEGGGLADLLRAVCPGGSITGAPKIRAMQIIEELESFRRGLYCGNIGVIGPEGRSMMLNIAIRTILMQAGAGGERAYVYAGGGIVADSDAQAEYQETLDKAAAMLKALGVRR